MMSANERVSTLISQAKYMCGVENLCGVYGEIYSGRWFRQKLHGTAHQGDVKAYTTLNLFCT